MGRAPCCSKVGMHTGPWAPREDTLLINYIQAHGQGNWRSLPKNAGLNRCGKSCRLRWMNYLRPDIKRGNITPDEEDLIIKMHALLGNRWSLIAGRLPGRTDNEIKNYWNTNISKTLRSKGIDPWTHKKLTDLDHRKTTNPRKMHPATASTVYTKQNKNEAKIELEKLKIHNPKAVRFTSLKISTTNNKTPLSEVKKGESITETIFKDIDDCNKIDFLVGDDFFDVSDLNFQLMDPRSTTHDNNLDDLLEEYLQLLNP